jgi:hypothetical protein
MYSYLTFFGGLNNIVTGCRLSFWGSIPHKGRDFSLCYSIHTDCGIYPTSYPMILCNLIEVKNEGSCFSWAATQSTGTILSSPAFKLYVLLIISIHFKYNLEG